MFERPFVVFHDGLQIIFRVEGFIAGSPVPDFKIPHHGLCLVDEMMRGTTRGKACTHAWLKKLLAFICAQRWRPFKHIDHLILTGMAVQQRRLCPR